VTKGELIKEVEEQLAMVQQVTDYLNELLGEECLTAADIMDAVAYNDLRFDFTKIITFDQADLSLSSLAYMATINPAWFEDAKSR
jgi:hypothetical protein